MIRYTKTTIRRFFGRIVAGGEGGSLQEAWGGREGGNMAVGDEQLDGDGAEAQGYLERRRDGEWKGRLLLAGVVPAGLVVTPEVEVMGVLVTCCVLRSVATD